MARLDDRHRRGGVADVEYRERREALVGELERVYGELDSEAAPEQEATA